MDRTVAHLNIEYFRKLLAEEMAETKLQTIRGLLAEEEAKCRSRPKQNVQAKALPRASGQGVHPFGRRFRILV
jgi:hypothetical protein